MISDHFSHKSLHMHWADSILWIDDKTISTSLILTLEEYKKGLNMTVNQEQEFDGWLVEEKIKLNTKDVSYSVKYSLFISCGEFGQEIVKIPIEEDVFNRLKKAGLPVSVL